MTHTYNMSTMGDLKQIVQFLTQLLNKLETNMTTLNVQVGLHFDKIEVLEGKLDVVAISLVKALTMVSKLMRKKATIIITPFLTVPTI